MSTVKPAGMVRWPRLKKTQNLLREFGEVGEKVNLGEKAKVDGEKLYIFLNARKVISRHWYY